MVGDVHALEVDVWAKKVKASDVDAVTTDADIAYFSAKSVETQDPPDAPGMVSVEVAGDVPGVAIVTAKGEVEQVLVPALTTVALPNDQMVVPVTTLKPDCPCVAVLVKLKAAVATANPPATASMATTVTMYVVRRVKRPRVRVVLVIRLLPLSSKNSFMFLCAPFRVQNVLH